MCAQHATLLVFGLEFLLDQFGPEHAGRAELSDLHVEVHSHGKEERHTGSHLVDIKTGGLSGTDVLDTVSEGKGELKLAVGTSLLHVIS